MTRLSEGKQTFIDLLEEIADHKFVLGDRLVEVGISGPNLEATLSSIAMAQGELGHARLLYNWVYDLKETGSKPEITQQTGKAIPQALEIENWVKLIAVLYPVNSALNIILHNLLASKRPEIVRRIHKLVKEQEEHYIFAKDWADFLLSDEGDVPVTFQKELDQAVQQIQARINRISQSTALIEEGYLSQDNNMVVQFHEEVASLKKEGALK